MEGQIAKENKALFCSSVSWAIESQMFAILKTHWTEHLMYVHFVASYTSVENENLMSMIQAGTLNKGSSLGIKQQKGSHECHDDRAPP